MISIRLFPLATLLLFATTGFAQSPERTVSLPKDTWAKEYKELAYLSSQDAVTGFNYEYLAFKETKKKTGEWKLRIKGSKTAGTFFRPDSASLKRTIKKAAKEGKNYIVHGFQMMPAKNDPRLVENRLYFDKSLQPTAIEMHVVTRNADGSPKKRKIVKFAWPD